MSFTTIPEELLARATPAERQAYANALRKHIALRSPLDFAVAVRPEAKEYRHTRYISDAIADIPAWGGLIVLMGPRHGKSYLCSESMPAWALARDHNARVLHASYGHDYTASKLSPKVHELIKANVPLTPKLHSRRQAITDFLVDPKVGSGFYFGTGVDGPMTGMPADWLVLDDLIKNANDAKSKTIRDNVWRWYTTVAEQRLEPEGRTLVVGTPWHEDDILNRLINFYKDDPRWRIVRLPSIAMEDDELGREPGEPLCPERYPIEELERKKRMDPVGFAAQHQGRPTPQEGDVFKAKNLLSYDPAKLPERGFRFATCDLAHSTKQHADFSVITCFFWSAPPYPRLFITHMFRDKVDSGRHMEWLDEQMASIPKAERPSFVGVEDKTFGSTLLAKARREGRRGQIMLRPLSADKDKETRAQPAATLSTQGQLLFPEGAPYVEDAKHELLVFPNGSHDDIVDTIAYGAITVIGLPQRGAPAKERKLDRSPEAAAAAHIKRKQKAKKPNPVRARKALMH